MAISGRCKMVNDKILLTMVNPYFSVALPFCRAEELLSLASNYY